MVWSLYSLQMREIETVEDVSTPFDEEISEENESEWEIYDFSSSSSDECDDIIF